MDCWRDRAIRKPESTLRRTCHMTVCTASGDRPADRFMDARGSAHSFLLPISYYQLNVCILSCSDPLINILAVPLSIAHHHVDARPARVPLACSSRRLWGTWSPPPGRAVSGGAAHPRRSPRVACRPHLTSRTHSRACHFCRRSRSVSQLVSGGCRPSSARSAPLLRPDPRIFSSSHSTE